MDNYEKLSDIGIKCLNQFYYNTYEKLLVADKNIGIRDQLIDFWAPQVIKSMMMSSFCKS